MFFPHCKNFKKSPNLLMIRKKKMTCWNTIKTISLFQCYKRQEYNINQMLNNTENRHETNPFFHLKEKNI